MAAPAVDILLGTFNGARHLRAQIESLLGQEDVSFRILVRDDGSSDETSAILEDYRRARPELITRLDGSDRLGVIGNFSRLLGSASAPYAALSDQDDVWAPRKLRVLLNAMHDLEGRYGAAAPLLVHSDLTVVDEALRELQPSFWRYSGFDARRTSLARLLLKNTTTGCASLMNLALIRLALPIPQAALLHDYWLALVAAAAGHIDTVAEPLVAYRQHQRNIVGARPYAWRSAVERLASGLKTWDIDARRHQAAALLERCQSLVTPEDRTLLEDFIGLPDRSWLGRRWLLLRRGILMPGLMRNLALFFLTRLGV
jgi:glycosyltransferase involved in cell wall biosynthesis